ncbi:MAG: polysaccharide biosynthesis protein [Anaerovoracaceae bacterium]|nr:polysaccharide biosynthesis protein [Bacillota bacterium]MDY3954822.1 polysaccharide biosynthesis protein [Anaerovoracaceae bacterium]
MATKKTFFQGAVILGVAGLIIKVLGAVFRIPLGNIIGDTGMGYYQTAYPVYVFLLTLSTAGVPVAISRMVSERNAVNQPYEAFRVFKISFLLLLGIGLCCSAVLFFGADMIVSYLKPEENGESAYAMMAVAPALLIVPIMAAFRGFFQGCQDMRPTAASQIVEQFFRVAVGLTLAVLLLKKGLPFAAAGASFGATAGAAGGLLIVIWIYMNRRKKILRGIGAKCSPQEPAKKILLQILIIAIPITIGSAVMPIINIIDVAVVSRRLVFAGFSGETANALYGQLTGMAGPLINFPQVLTQAIAMSLVPTVAAAHKVKDYPFLQHNVELGLRTALILGVPCALGLMTLAEPIMLLLYPAKQAAAVSAAPSLFILSFGVIFLSMVQTTTGILQGIGKQMIPVKNIMIGAAVKIALTYTLTAIPNVNIKGAAVGTVACYLTASMLNLMAVRKHTGARINAGRIFMKPLASGLVMSAATYGVYRILSVWCGNTVSVLIAVCAAVAVYGFMLLATRAVTEEELALLPKGQRLAKIVRKFQR